MSPVMLMLVIKSHDMAQCNVMTQEPSKSFISINGGNIFHFLLYWISSWYSQHYIILCFDFVFRYIEICFRSKLNNTYLWSFCWKGLSQTDAHANNSHQLVILLSHWRHMASRFLVNIGLCNGLSPIWRKANTLISADLVPIGPSKMTKMSRNLVALRVII